MVSAVHWAGPLEQSGQSIDDGVGGENMNGPITGEESAQGKKVKFGRVTTWPGNLIPFDCI